MTPPYGYTLGLWLQHEHVTEWLSCSGLNDGECFSAAERDLSSDNTVPILMRLYINILIRGDLCSVCVCVRERGGVDSKHTLRQLLSAPHQTHQAH